MFGRIRLLVRTILHLLLWAFVSASVIYTTNLLVISPLSSLVSSSVDALVSHITWRHAPTPAVDSEYASSSVSASARYGYSYPLGAPERSMLAALRAQRANASSLSSSSSSSSSPFPGPDSNSLALWPPSSAFIQQHPGLGHRAPVPLAEQALLSKLLANSMRPSDVVPYFYRATDTFDPREVTVTTLITSNRLEVFARLVERYRGPISVTLHIHAAPNPSPFSSPFSSPSDPASDPNSNPAIDPNTHIASVLHALAALRAASPTMRRTVDVHLVVDAFDRQFNTWRNLARAFARTEFVMMLDIDFWPCTELGGVLGAVRGVGGAGGAGGGARRGGAGTGTGRGGGGGGQLPRVVADALDRGHAALVIPAFEYTAFHEGTDSSTFPTSKKELLRLVEQRRVGMFHASWAPGHNASEYERFYAAAPGEVYKVTRYQSAYEPYVIFKRDGPPWCDERFVGYGGNKAACLFEMYLAGIAYYVHADHFIIHQNHQYEERARKNERKINRKIYGDFREETCLRYLKRFRDETPFDAARAENALAECRKIRSLTRSTDMAVKALFESG